MNCVLLERAIAADLLDRVVAISAACSCQVDAEMQTGTAAVRAVVA